MGPIEAIQKKLGVPTTGAWDPITLGALAAFQAGQSALVPNGHPDVPTLAVLGYYDPMAVMEPKLQAYVQGGKKPSTFGRDLASASNQTPRWAWLGVGVLLIGVGYLGWKKSKRKA